MSGPAGLAALSDDLMTATIVIYSLAMLGYAAELALGRGHARASAGAPRRALVGAGAQAGPGARADSGGWPDTVTPGAGAPPGHDARGSVAPSEPEAVPDPAAEARSPRQAHVGPVAGRIAVALTVLGWGVHLGAILARGFAADRWPWGNMYEFASALAFAAVTAFLVLLYRRRVQFLGLFVMIPVVLGLGLAVTVLYTSVGPLVPALNSYWIAIHVTAAIVASGTFTVATAATVLYLVVDRYQRRRAAGLPVGFSGLARSLPGKDVLDQVAYRAVAFAFPMWTFAVIAGAIWAEAAWGRYWGWDVKETWSFITWVVYAAYLHARVTAGWRGTRLAVVALAGYACFLFNLFGVNLLLVGLHSYAGVP